MKKGVAIFLFWLVSLSAWAVIIAGGDGSGHTDGTGVIGWDYVGKINHASAHSSVTYVGHDWFVTAYHIKHFDNPTGVVFNASTYSIDNSSWTRITNSTGTNADLVLFRVNEAVSGISAPLIASASPTNGTAVTMIGSGRNRASGLTLWKADWTETTDPDEAVYSGYKWASGSTKRWGSNHVEGTGSVSYGFGPTDFFYTQFDNNPGEAQGATYDSGGGVFTGTTDDWALAGIMVTIGPYTNQPGSTAVFGNKTYIADLALYRDQILQTIPEPSTVLLVAGVAALVVAIRRFQRMMS